MCLYIISAAPFKAAEFNQFLVRSRTPKQQAIKNPAEAGLWLSMNFYCT
jgi:hypothetical protein